MKYLSLGPGLITLIIVLSLSTMTYGQHLPDKYTGTWEGTLYISKDGSLSDSIKSRLTIKAINDTSWTWKTEFLSETRPVLKDYVLRLSNEEKGHYIMDEGRGLELLVYEFSNKLFSNYALPNLWLSSSYEFNKDNIIFEIISGKEVNETGYNIRNYSVTSQQWIKYKRVK